MDDPNARKKFGAQKADGLMGKKSLDQDMNMFTLGLDLTNFGLNLTDNEYHI